LGWGGHYSNTVVIYLQRGGVVNTAIFCPQLGVGCESIINNLQKRTTSLLRTTTTENLRETSLLRTTTTGNLSTEDNLY
jgi:hypothetical protein